jgi:hypothetical protein
LFSKPLKESEIQSLKKLSVLRMILH